MSGRLAPSEFAASGPHGVLALEPHLDLKHALEPPGEVRDARSAPQRSTTDGSPLEQEIPGAGQPRAGIRVTWRRPAMLLVAILTAGGVVAALAYPDILPAAWWAYSAKIASEEAAQARSPGSSTPAPKEPAPPSEPDRSPDTIAVATSSNRNDDENRLVRSSTPGPASAASPLAPAVDAEAVPAASHPSRQEEISPEDALALLPTPQEDEIQVVRSAGLRNDDSLQRAWDALATGRPRAALTLYRQVLARQPDHIAAQLGEATALARAGLTDEAARRYRAVLERDPEHPVARANLLLLRAAAGEAVLEQEVQALLSEQPSSSLYALLGHLRGHDGRWPAAREAFQAAHHLEPERADHLFNLGVSLEQLGEPEAALAVYRRAARATGTHPMISIDPAVIARRIAALSDEHTN